MRWMLRVPQPVSLRDHLAWAFLRAALIWAAVLIAGLAVLYLPLGITRIL